ncbi:MULTISPECIES: helix-turn-helix transcriptional regulator [unclassified Streptomyces]|uniref:helix-turn-helix transcriptional regulator n=1 Tax=unclassified Streptomyces TaxID=2593676 RepID=UPI001CB72AAF|nr:MULTISPECIES: helix-turn-helix transcriptional regulator [unclassified Streptomyces]
MLGLQAVHESVYQAMVEHSTWGVIDLARHLRLTEAEVRSALDALFELRLIRDSYDRPGHVKAVGRDELLRIVLQHQQDDLARQQLRMAEQHAAVTRMISRIALAPEPARTVAEVEKLSGMDAVQQRLELLAEQASVEILTLMPGGGHSAPALEAARRNDAQVLARGVPMRTIALESIRQHEPTLNHARWLTDHGGEFRTAPALPPRMIVVDRQAALVPLDPANTRAGILYLTSPGVVASLRSLFERVWSYSTPLGADSEPAQPGLSDLERGVLQLAGEGLTDEAVASRLHISARSARRTMAALMERLDAHSRFSAGVKAAQRGWL